MAADGARARSVWVLNHYGGLPGTVRSERTWRVSDALAGGGYSVDFFAASWHHLLGAEWRRESEGRCEERDGYRFHAVPTRAYSGNGLGRLRNMTDFFGGLKIHARRVENDRKPDVIVASSPHPFTFSFARWAKRRFGCKIVLEERDLWPLSLVQLAGMKRWHPLALFFERMVRCAYRRCDALVSLLEFSEPYLRSRGLPQGKFHYIPNGVVLSGAESEAPVRLPGRLESDIASVEAERRAVAIYTGAMGPPNGLLRTLDIAQFERAGESLPFHLFLVGDGTEREELEKRIAAKGIRSVSVYGPVAKVEAKALVRRADVCLLSLLPAQLFEYGISPNKLFEYFEASKPVVFFGGGAKNPVTNSGGGVCVNDISGLVEALVQISEMEPAKRDAMGAKGRDYVRNDHGWEQLGKRYVAVCDRVLESS